jgi:hypothetical protein
MKKNNNIKFYYIDDSNGYERTSEADISHAE